MTLSHRAATLRHRAEAALFSSVTMRGGPVCAHEFQTVGVASPHVVLSACEVGSEALRPGDQAMGLASSLWSLGADSLVASPIPVSDEVSYEVMVAHHRGLARGLATDEALAQAVAAAGPEAATFLALGATVRFGGADGHRAVDDTL